MIVNQASPLATHEIFISDASEICRDRDSQTTIKFEKAFQQFSNLGGLGPDNGVTPTSPVPWTWDGTGTVDTPPPFADYKYPDGIRYVNIADVCPP